MCTISATSFALGSRWRGGHTFHRAHLRHVSLEILTLGRHNLAPDYSPNFWKLDSGGV